MMNERIKELAKQAGFAMKIDDDPNSPPGWWGAGHDPTFEKFAELIIKECIERIKPVKYVHEIKEDLDMKTLPTYVIAAARTECIAEIKQHFGIK
jgi:hypothetical protein